MLLIHRSIVTLSALIASSAAVLAQPPVAQAPIDQSLVPYASMANSVTLPDGRTLHLVCSGKGSPVVIFTAGANGWSGQWSRVQPAIAKTTRTCAWDRPGFGLSDGIAGKPTVATNTADLEAALKAGGIAGPYVMVGQSLGGYETLLFADRNRAKVVGMVLVDPSIPDQGAIAKRLAEQYEFHAPAPAPGAPTPPSFAEIWRRCAGEVRDGTLKAGGPDAHGCLAFLQPPTPPAVSAAVGTKLLSSPRQFETMAAFSADALDDGAMIVINPKRNYGAMPLIVLTATAQPPGDMGAKPGYGAAIVAVSTRAHDELAALSTRGVNARVPGAGHEMQFERPQQVIDAIDMVMGQARESAAR